MSLEFLNKTVAIIQARLESTRFPNKCMQTVGGIPMVRRVWLAAKGCKSVDQVVVAWPERYPDVDQNNVLERFRRIAEETGATRIVRLTSDCPLLTSDDISRALARSAGKTYYSNHLDGKDVQVFNTWVLESDHAHREHVIADFSTLRYNAGPRSVDTPEDLEYVRNYAR